MTPWGEPPQPHWPAEDEAATTSSTVPREAASPYGPQFAWRARVLWALGAVVQFGAALLVAGLVVTGGTAGTGPLLLAAIFAAFGIAFLATRRALGGRQAWAGTTSLALAWGFILGGIARAAIAFGSHTFLIPLEPLVGIWALMPADRPRLRFGRPADWRAPTIVALVIALELTNLAPIVPAGVPFIDSLGAGQDALDLRVHVDCPGPDAVWSQTGVDVDWTWRGLDLFSLGDDRLTLSVSSPAQATMSWDPMMTNLAIANEATGGPTIAFTVPTGRKAGSVHVDLTQSERPGSVPFTVTAAYRHGGRWEVTRAASCAP